MTFLIAVLIVGVGTYFSRAFFIVALADRKLSDVVLVAIQFVAPAVLSALVVALLIDSEGNVAIGVPEMSAFAVGGVVAYRTKNHIWTLIAGMATYWVVRALI
jgi:branched-subunit amino acid transport protein